MTGAESSAARRLVDSSNVRFTLPKKSSPKGTKFYALEEEHGTEVIPGAFVNIDPTWLDAQCPQVKSAAGWMVQMMSCDIFDFGVASIVVRWVPEDDTAARATPEPQWLDLLTSATERLTTEAADVVAAACRTSLAQDPCRSDLLHGVDIDLEEILPPVGAPLWLWHVLLMSSPAGRTLDTTLDVARRLCPNSFELLEHRDHAFAGGVHVSVACSAAGSELDGEYLARVPRAMDPWWTLFWRLDRVLLALQLHLQLDGAAASPSGLQERASLLRDVGSRVALWQTRLDSILVAAGARDNDAWTTLATAWRFEERKSAVERKLSLLESEYADALARIESVKTSRVNLMIYLFTAFSVIASVVGVVEYAQGANDPRVAIRGLIVAIATFTAAAAVGLSLRNYSVRRQQE